MTNFQFFKIGRRNFWAIIAVSMAVTFCTSFFVSLMDRQAKIESFDIVCRLILPKIQIGAFRETQEVLISIFSSSSYASNVLPVIKNGGTSFVSPGNTSFANSYTCNFEGLTNTTLVFYYNTSSQSWTMSVLELIFVSLALIYLYTWIRKRIQMGERRKIESMQNQQIAQMSKQVAHDIRSPLSALSMILTTLNG